MPSLFPILDCTALYAMVRKDLFAMSEGQGDRIGLEIELFPVVRDAAGELVPVPLSEVEGWQGPTLARLLEGLVREEGWEMNMSSEGEGIASVDVPEGGAITLEPAGQIEYSTAAHDTVRGALDDLDTVVEAIERACAVEGVELLRRGYNNRCREETLDLQVRKARYLAMDRHFNGIGPYGRKMMRATCALQINLDFGSADVVPERWRLVNMIAPSLNAIFANAPHVHEGQRYRSFRHEIWRNADPSRTGRLYDRPDLDPIADYLRFALDASVMMIRDEHRGAISPKHPMTFGEWLAGSPYHGYPDRHDWNLHLTTLFPDVRARGWMELRSIDALPREWWGVPAAMTAALLYDDDLRREALTRLEMRQRRRERWEHEHDGYWRSDFETGGELLSLAIPAIPYSDLAATAERYHAEFVARGLTPADLDAGQ